MILRLLTFYSVLLACINDDIFCFSELNSEKALLSEYIS